MSIVQQLLIIDGINLSIFFLRARLVAILCYAGPLLMAALQDAKRETKFQ
jgi:hypothetical protein